MTRVSHSGGAHHRTRAAFSVSCDRAVEALERRVLLSTFTVINTNDSGPGSLRQAILDANANTGTDTIAFSIPGVGLHAIAPQSPLPIVTETLDLAGRTQPGYSALTGTPVIEVTGTNAGAGAEGLVFGPTCTGGSVEGLDINGFSGNGLVLQGRGSSVKGCYIGTDSSGTLAWGNGGNGVVISGTNCIVSGTTRADRNVISANGMAGVLITAGSVPTELTDCFIGVTASGTGALGNAHEGVLADGPVSLRSFLGDGSTWARDVVSGNGYSGIVLDGGSSTVIGAMVGVNLDGTAALANGVAPAAPYRDGITLLGGTAAIGQRITSPAQLPNVISANQGAGVYLGAGGQTTVAGNVIGTDRTGSLPLGNAGDGIVIAGDHVAIGIAPGSTGNVLATGGNVIAGNGGDGVRITGSSASVLGQYVGINVAGAPMGNHGNGIEIQGGSRNAIGNLSSAIHNVISANGGAGVAVSGAGTGNLIQGNYVGTTPAGTLPTGNQGNGVEVFCSENTVAGNLISANGGSGVLLGAGIGGPTSANMVLNNSIGLSAPTGAQVAPANAGVVPDEFGNQGDGITVNAANANTIKGNKVNASGLDGVDIIGGSQNQVAQNALTQNGGNGVTVRESAPGAGDAVGNGISQNTFVTNARLPIDLGNDGPTPDDPGDKDTGPDQLQNFPAFVSATTSGGSTTVRFTLDTQAGTYRVEFYSVVPPVALSGATLNLLAVTTITVAGDPAEVFTAVLPGLTPGSEVTAGATGVAGTSEFMPDSTVFPTPPVVTSAAYLYYTPRRAVAFVFDQDVSASLTPDEVRLHNLQTGQDFTPVSVSWNAASNQAQFVLPPSLPIGSYVATLFVANIANTYGQHPASNDSFNFRYLPGDTNNDGTVNFADLLFLAMEYGDQFTTSADINGNGVVDFNDLLILAQNYGKSVPAP